MEELDTISREETINTLCAACRQDREKCRRTGFECRDIRLIRGMPGKETWRAGEKLSDGEYLKGIRGRLLSRMGSMGISDKQLAIRAGVGENTLKLQHDIRICTLRRIAAALEVSVSYLVGDTGKN